MTQQDLLTLTHLSAGSRQITNVEGLEAARNLRNLDLDSNSITNFSIAEALTNLTNLDLRSNQLITLTLPSGMTNLATLLLDANPLNTLVMPAPLAETSLAGTVATLRNQGVSVFTYRLAVQLTRLQSPIGAFRFSITGPPGVYAVFASTNLPDWTVLGAVPNPVGTITFTDTEAHLAPRKLYRALLLAPPITPPDIVFISPNTFTLGSPSTEVGHQPDESPQTIVKLTHGFWMARFLVTQRNYLDVMGSNPSGFPGDLDRPVEKVPWPDATNYYAKLTERDLLAGRIPPGSHYRLPTEAEWECAARAGTSTRFYYGDDPNVTSLTNHAWYSANSGFTPRPVGQKLPNAWGLYDMAGNVWEWCQDWYGPYPGGTATDPQGPGPNAIGWKVIRGGAWESFDLDCRSARRSFQAASPFISDFIIGFRVVLELP
ncbi:MAG: hypothetical protein JWM16_3614 [Verrucomicrobiales bacterium]|nr:hypothetical protein [Verrucomicrobiales bacterium]